MSRSWARKLAVIVGFILAATVGSAWAQEGLPFTVTGRILFGVADYSQGDHSVGGPSATLETDLKGYWRDPRILEFEFKPTTTIGQAVPGTDMGNAVTGFSASGKFLEGSPFPLTLSYTRSGGSFEQPRTSQGVLSGVQIDTTNTVFDANWMLRLRNLPTIILDYRDTDYNSELPTAFGGSDDHSVRNFTGQINYNSWGWQLGGHYQHTQSTATFPDILAGGLHHDSDTSENLGFSASRLLPLHSSLGVSGNQTKSSFNFDSLATDTTVRIGNATLTSQPVQRVTTTLQAQYTSNLQDYQLQQALSGAGVPGTVSPGAVSPVPLTFLAAPFQVLSLGGGVGIRLGHGFSINGSVGESHSSNLGRSTQWSAGPSYQRDWRSGWFSASYSHSHTAAQTEVLSADATTGVVTTPQSNATYTLFSQGTDMNTGGVNLSQTLPARFKVTTSAHVSEGTLRDNGVPYPNHSYGGLASLTRPLGEWTVTGSFNLEKNAANHALIYNQSTAKGISLAVVYRGLALSVSRQSGNGLALQMGSNLLWVSNPELVGTLLGTPVLSSTAGRTITGSYHSRSNRLMLRGYWGHFSYTTNNLPATEYRLLNLNASYKLRRLRLIAGYSKQSQVFSIGPSGIYDTRLMYFQIERVFRIH